MLAALIVSSLLAASPLEAEIRAVAALPGSRASSAPPA